MKNINKELKLFITLSKLQPMLTRAFEGRLGGLGYNEFIILYHLNQSSDGKMRRIDLANKVGLTPSGITRMLLPMEKVGYIKREAHEGDARVSFVAIAPGGKRRLEERLEDASELASELISDKRYVDSVIDFLDEIGKNVSYK